MDYPDDVDEEPEANLVVFPPLLLLSASTTCWNCKKQMIAVALGAHALVEDGETVGDIADTHDMFVLSNVDVLPPEVFEEIVLRNPHLERRHSHMAGTSYLANVCPHCDRLTGDFYLHAEPGGAFFPTTIEEASRISVEHLPLPGPVNIGGSWGYGTGEFILSHAKRSKD